MIGLDQLLSKYRLSRSEYELIVKQLGREPAGVEWAVYSALWSEHCSYKSSKIHLKKFARTTKGVLASMGENAGVVDLGQGERIAFKMESHNHPSYIEPYQGAATGVGGILRDIFTMGARPIALANYLCFGEPTYPRMQKLVDGVVRGIAGYGNCVGVPMITGQTEFDASYNQNILVNALAVGYLGAKDVMASAKGSEVGALVVYVGAKTGRDGIHGASMASQSFDEKSAGQRPTVQIGDPFYEKLLIESCIEVIQEKLVIAIQDMGAAGLTSSSFEMAARGQVGLRLDLDRVPLRDHTLTPEDILLSESQERMLLMCHKENFPRIEQIFKNWDLDAVVIGEVIKENQVVLRWHNEVIAKIDPQLVVESAPVYDRSHSPWKTKPISLQPQGGANLAEKDFIFNQYDQRVGASTVLDCSAPIGAVVLPSKRVLGLALGCRPQLMKADARQGALDAIALPAVKLAAFGFKPVAATDCLNFGNPERIEIMSEFVASVDAITEICEILEVPVVSGNVSFYNQTSNKDITSTPAVGLIGLRECVEGLPSAKVLRTGLKMVRLATEKVDTVDPLAVKALVELLCASNDRGIIHAVGVVGEYGRTRSLARMLSAHVGIELLSNVGRTDVMCPLYEVLLAVDGGDIEKIRTMCERSKLVVEEIGQTNASGKLTGFERDLSFVEFNELRAAAWREHFGSLS